ncbi:putative parvulin-like peptidyl-prolyl isomerase [Vibrio nigripulchritudo ATCC 27043]|uniref:peptidylprolyl isomerase SurA n=1 Tax=Vibrio nigripulchritudo TaxID=28173 RepID=UPI00021C2639|nr:peptidylprolyl isomerase SurA [Vibrio nigripulchritudo]EGU59716.1 putative parvulin-like peptidyl-prolyl isomerase [Vibrio nigripulchritudo ATCC 27043]
MKMWKKTLLSLTIALGSFGAFAQPVELDKVVVIVNEGVILQSDIDSALKTIRANARAANQALPSADILRDQVLEKLILDTIQTQQAEKLGVRIDDNRLELAIKEIAANQKKSVTQLRQSLSKEGLSYAEFREQVRNEIAASEARNAQVRRRINILPAEVESLAEILAKESNATVQYKVNHIQLRFNDNQTKQEVEKQAKQLVSQINAGEDFKTMAYTYSKGPKALQGGDWGWLRKEEMPTIFADQITTQGKGAVIGPFRSGVGFHIIKLEDVKGLETVAVTEVNARHILIKTSVILSDEGAKRELNEYIRQINAGERTFGDLAQQYSADPGSAANNGELGFQTPDLYVPEFKHQIETLPVGQISKPFETVHGWHIVEVLDRRKVDRTDSALTNKAYRILFNRKFNEEVGAWMQEIRAGAYVEVLGEENDS